MHDLRFGDKLNSMVHAVPVLEKNVERWNDPRSAADHLKNRNRFRV